MIITSKTNNNIKYISSLKNKKYRNKYNKYVVEGIKLVEEIINSEGNAPEFIVYSEDILKKSTIGLEFLNKINDGLLKGHNVIAITEDVFKYITDVETPQGTLAVIEKNNEYGLASLRKKLGINKEEKFIMLDKIQDPGNLGTIIRSAASFDVKNIICLEGTVDAFSPKVVRSTMGGIIKVNIYNILETETEEMLETLKTNGYSIVATDLDAKEYVHNQKLDKKHIFVLGNEANGVSEKILELCDRKVKIPMESAVESLNVSTAGTILIYEQYIGGIK